ncbi:MAG TPA: ArsR family transcriptional regulator [Candidatus Thermoplasmatota archaeon]|nr:ArsR family transcriptional regulator [Candidatus Thermoplasmatota archaeon]
MKNKEEALQLDTRRAIYDYIKTTPGAHLRKVHRAVGLPFGQVLYHLNYMERNELIVVKKDGKFNRYFVKHLIGRKEKDIISVLRHDVPRRVSILLLFQPRLTHKEILQYVEISPSTLSFHLSKMVEVGVVGRENRGRESYYWLTDEKLTAKVLIMHRESFNSDVVDRFADVWLTMNYREPTTREEAAKTDEYIAKKVPDGANLALAVLHGGTEASASPTRTPVA